MTEPTGRWDADALKRGLRRQRVSDPWPLYQELLDREFTQIEPVLGSKRAIELKSGIWEVRQGSRSA